MTGWITNLVDSSPAVIVPAGAVIALAVIALIWRSLRKQAPDKLAVRIAVLLASAFSAQGMYEVATTKLHLPPYLAAGLFAVAEMGMLASAVRAHRFYEKTGQLGPHARFVWIIATAAGIIVSLNAHSPSEYFLRLLMPLLVAGLWRMGYVAEEVRAKAADAITLRWTPRRLGILLGIIEPGERDLATVNAERQRRQMIAHAHAFHRGSLLLGVWHASRLRKLALMADDDTIAEVQRSVDRVHRIEASTAPVSTGAVLAARWWLKPWTSARRTAVAVEQMRAEHIAVSARTAEQIAEQTRELTARLAAADSRAHAAEQDAIRREHTARVETEQAVRAEAEQELAELREQLREGQRIMPPRSARTESTRPAARRAGQVSATSALDEQIVEKLLGPFTEQAEQTGSVPSRYWVQQNGSCWPRQASRVLDLLTARYTESKREPKSGSAREQTDDASERELVGATA